MHILHGFERPYFMRNFAVNSEDCELLLLFNELKSLDKISSTLNKDASVVSRQLKSLALRTNTLEKIDGRWQVSKLGTRLISWATDAIEDQKSSLKGKKNIKIATTREFAARLLIPQIRTLIGEKDVSVSLISSDEGVENLLLSGKADFGFDCGRPNDPAIAFKKIVKESFVCVAAPKFVAKRKVAKFQDLQIDDCLKFMRTELSMLDLEIDTGWYFGIFSDIASQREAALMGFGWAIIPYYAVAREIEKDELVIIPGKKFEEENYGVWWARSKSKPEVLEIIEKAKNWLKTLEEKLLLK